MVALTCTAPPHQATHWSGRAMAKAIGISVGSVQRIWRKHKLQPYRLRTFKRSRDPSFAAKLSDIVGLYVDPPAHAVGLSIDEKSQIQALDRTQPGLPIKPGRCQTMTHDYKRHSLPSRKRGHHHAVRRAQRARRHRDRPLHAAPPSQRIHPLPQRRRAQGPGRQGDPHGARQLRHAQTPQKPALANAGVLARLARHPRWIFHFTPTSASWLNAVENFFSKMTRQRIRRGVFRSIADLQAAINAYLAEHNASPKPFVWTQSADAILAKLDRCPVPSVQYNSCARGSAFFRKVLIARRSVE